MVVIMVVLVVGWVVGVGMVIVLNMDGWVVLFIGIFFLCVY